MSPLFDEVALSGHKFGFSKQRTISLGILFQDLEQRVSKGGPEHLSAFPALGMHVACLLAVLHLAPCIAMKSGNHEAGVPCTCKAQNEGLLFLHL